jgi:hypothetical protein
MDFSFMDELRDEADDDDYDDGDNDDEHSLEVDANQDMFDPFHSTRREYGSIFPTEFTEIGPPLALFQAESRRVGLGVTR